MIIKENVTSQEQIEKLGSALTWEGFTIDDENINDMFDWLVQYTPVKQRKIYIIKGALMNKLYNTDYNDDLNIVCVDLNDIENINKILLKRFDVGAHWLDDLIDNYQYEGI